MGLKDTGLSNNTPNDSEVSPNRDLEQPGTGEDSDSDLDTNDHWGDYMPLSQNPQDGEILYSMNDGMYVILLPANIITMFVIILANCVTLRRI